MSNLDTTSLLSKLYSVDQQEILNSLVEINETIQITWAEVSEELPKLVELCESFVNNLQLANLVTSKAYFYIGSYEKAVQHALEAGELFDFHCNSDYNNKIISTLVEVYITTRKENKVVPEKYELALEQQECYIALGVAMEAKRIDIIERALNCSSEKNAIIEYIKKDIE
ncbi:26S proteasome non-ATPase regulatory subunit 1-like protein [Entamoeba marina]